MARHGCLPTPSIVHLQLSASADFAICAAHRFARHVSKECLPIMSNDTLLAADVARFLELNPGFLSEHAEIFSRIAVPHPHLPHVIPLGERQNLMLRERVRALELKLAELSHQAARNERIVAQLHAWLAGLLAENDAASLAPRFVLGLVREFSLQGATLLAWQPHAYAHAGSDSSLEAEPATGKLSSLLPLAEDALQQLQRYTTALSRPACTATSTADKALAPLLATIQTDTPAAGSLAIVPLHAMQQEDGGITEDAGVATGLLVLSDLNRDRYVPNMDTLFLERIAHLASALLVRLQTARGNAHSPISVTQ